MTDINDARRQYPRAVPETIPDTGTLTDAELAHMLGREAQPGQQVPESTEKPEPSDVEYVANNLDRLRYLDLKKVAKDMFGDAKPGTPAEFADLMAEWAAANKTKGTGA